MKILQVNNVYDWGSTGKITADVHRELLRRGYESLVYYGRRDAPPKDDPCVRKFCGEFYSKVQHFATKFTGVPYQGFKLSTARLLRAIERENPDVVHLQCLNGYFVDIYRLIEFLKKRGQKTVLTLHAEFMHTGGCGHALECERWRETPGCGSCPRWKSEFHSLFFDRSRYMLKRMIEAFRGFERENLIVTSVSPWLMGRARESRVLRDFRHVVVFNGLDETVFRPTPSTLRQELGIADDERVVFHATPAFSANPSHLKGGYYLLELAKKAEVRGLKTKFLVACSTSTVDAAQLPKNVVLLGAVKERERLAQLYSLADVTALVSKKETFSMVVAESLSCGTPVVAFKAGGPEGIALSDYSRFVEYGDVEALFGALAETLNRPWDKEQIGREAGFAYSKETMCANFIEIYKSFK